jgi:hypothetical protein
MSDLGEISSHHSPCYPSVESVFSVIETSIQELVVLDGTDASFDAGSKADSFSEPRLLFVLSALVGTLPGLG